MKKTMRNVLIGLICFSSAATAASASEPEGSSLLLTLFIAFGVLVIIFQFIPAVLMLLGVVKGIWEESKGETEAESTLND